MILKPGPFVVYLLISVAFRFLGFCRTPLWTSQAFILRFGSRRSQHLCLTEGSNISTGQILQPPVQSLSNNQKRLVIVKKMQEDINHNYLHSITELFLYYKGLGDKALAQISDSEIHWRPDDESNSISVIVKHMRGNMLSRWTDFLTTDGEKEWRNRESEFVDDIKNKEAMLSIWEKGWYLLFSVLRTLGADDLQKIVYIRNEGHTVVEAINRHLTHCAQHIGQIIYIAKSLRAKSWQSLSIPKGKSEEFNKKKFSRPKRRKSS